jgi:4-hydroxy-2-oxoheptanedioate aldolase
LEREINVRRNTLRQLKAENKPIINAWLSVGSSYVAELAAHQGFDSVTIDRQHGMMGFETAVAMLQAISTTATIPLVRPSQNDSAEIMRLLDAGAYGIICPMISTRADAEALVSACRYAPDGKRSFGPARGLLYGGADYASHANAEILVFAMIETVEALANVEEIVATPGLDGIYIGPNDLALAMGYKPVPESEDAVVSQTIEGIRSSAAKHGLISGIFCSDGQAAASRRAQGFDLMTPGNDVGTLRTGWNDAINSARSTAG